MSATTGTVLANARLVLVWSFFLLPFGPFLCRVQGEFHYTALLGLAIVLLGIGLYEGGGGWAAAIVRRGRLKTQQEDPNYDDYDIVVAQITKL